MICSESKYQKIQVETRINKSKKILSYNYLHTLNHLIKSKMKNNSIIMDMEVFLILQPTKKETKSKICGFHLKSLWIKYGAVRIQTVFGKELAQVKW